MFCLFHKTYLFHGFCNVIPERRRRRSYSSERSKVLMIKNQLLILNVSLLFCLLFKSSTWLFWTFFEQALVGKQKQKQNSCYNSSRGMLTIVFLTWWIVLQLTRLHRDKHKNSLLAFQGKQQAKISQLIKYVNVRYQ